MLLEITRVQCAILDATQSQFADTFFSESAFGKLRIAIKYYRFNLLRSALFRVGGAHKSDLSMGWVNSWVGLGCIGIPDFFLIFDGLGWVTGSWFRNGMNKKFYIH